MIVGSLFSGVGGFDLGLEQAGHRIAWQCEADEWRRSVLATRFPGVECSPDVRDVGHGGRDASRLARGTNGHAQSGNGDRSATAAPGLAGAVDLICGGFPCQDLSVAGQRRGLLHEGGRSNLFFECARVADELLRPGGWLLLENVPGLLSSNSGRDFAVLLATLADLGFHDLAWRVLDSRFFGVAQRRRRVFILARRARGCRARKVLLEPEGGGGDPAPRGEAGPGLTRSLTGRSPSRLDDQGVGQLIAGPLQTGITPNGHGHAGVNDQAAADGHIVADTLTSGSHPNSNMPGRRREDDTNIISAPLTASMGNNAAHPGNSGLDELASGPAAVGAGVRRLTPRECERLQGFPDDWTAIPGAPDSRRYAAMGDAVTVPVARWIGERLMQYGVSDQATQPRGAPERRSVDQSASSC